jgi:syntaxin 16
MTAVVPPRRGSLPNLLSSGSPPATKPLSQALGPIRSLTHLYAKFRNDHKSKRSRFGYSLLGENNEGLGRKRVDLETGEEHLLESTAKGKGGVEVEMARTAPPWVQVSDRVKDCISKSRDKLISLQKLQQKRLLRVFDDDGGKGDIDVETTANTITNLLYQGERGIKELERFMTEDEKEVIVNIQRALATQLTKVSQDFKSSQKSYMNEIRKRKAGPSLFSDSSTSATDILDAGFTEDQLLELEGIESQVETRSQEINKIAKSITELNSVFKELANLVVEQGTILDRIDYNMENVVKDTAKANQELVKAENYQKGSRVQKCILMLVAFIVFNLLLITARN